LADLYGIQTAYYDISGHQVSADPDALVRVLQALGADIRAPHEARKALSRRRQLLSDRWTEPVHVVWDDVFSPVWLRLPVEQLSSTGHCTLTLENGEIREWSFRSGELSGLEPGLDQYGRVKKILSFPGTL